MQMFMNGRMGYDDPARLRAYANFRGNLEDILQTAHRTGVPVVLGCKATLYLHDHRSASCPNSQQLHSRRPVHKKFSSYSCICRCCGLGQAALQIQCPTAPVVLSTVAVNLKDCAPFASVPAAGLNKNQESAWNKIYEEGVALEASGSYGEALAIYKNSFMEWSRA